MSIIINISNSKINGLLDVRRTVTVVEYIKNYSEESFTIPYVLQHYDDLGQKITAIPDVYYTLVASNAKKIWVRANGTTSREFIADGQEYGMFTFFQNLQKLYTDQQILTQQILQLDSEGYFDGPA
jgi:hypothetical protein